MNDPLVSLATTMQSKKGVYALLLGSGISRSARIPTGWEIVLDLIERVAKASGEAIPDGGHEEWYKQKYDKAPEYGDVLGLVADAPAERSQVIRPYIEPNESERELGLKQPTDAHRAIAALVSSGYVRVIVTTNFDRLLETALAEVGVIPSVISSPDGINGTLPLAHNDCTIIKIHGDYTDARIKNTATELDEYDAAFVELVGQVCREYGLIVSGWSAEWDTALASILIDQQSRWFSTYWVSYSQPKAKAQEVIDARRATVITEMDADSFFTRLQEAVASIESMTSPELLSVRLAEESLKRYIDDPTKRIRIHDLVVGEALRVRQNLLEPTSFDYYEAVTAETVERRLAAYESGTEVLRTLFTTGCYWGGEGLQQNWGSALDRLGTFDSIGGTHYEGWRRLRYYPALITLYAGGLAALAAGRYDTLWSLLGTPTALDPQFSRRCKLIFLAHTAILEEQLARAIRPNTIPAAVLPLRIRDLMSSSRQLSEFVGNPDQFVSLFARFDYLLGMVHTDLAIQGNFYAWGPRGILPYLDTAAIQAYQEIDADITSQQEEWGPLKAGMFGGLLGRLNSSKEEHDRLIRRPKDFGVR